MYICIHTHILLNTDSIYYPLLMTARFVFGTHRLDRRGVVGPTENSGSPLQSGANSHIWSGWGRDCLGQPRLHSQSIDPVDRRMNLCPIYL